MSSDITRTVFHDHENELIMLLRCHILLASSSHCIAVCRQSNFTQENEFRGGADRWFLMINYEEPDIK